MRQIFTPSATAHLNVKKQDELKEPREMASEILSAIFQNVVTILGIVPLSAALIVISSSQVTELVMTRAIPQNVILITEIAGSATTPRAIVVITTNQPTIYVIWNACRFIAILTTTNVMSHKKTPSQDLMSSSLRQVQLLTAEEEDQPPVTLRKTRFMSMLQAFHKTNRMTSLEQVLWKTHIETCSEPQLA